MSQRQSLGVKDHSSTEHTENSRRGCDGKALALVVDDDERVLSLHSRVLSRAGLSVVAAADGRAALTLIEQGYSFHVVVSDVMMPNLNGLELLREIRERGEAMPVILVTGNLSLDIERLASQFGAFCCLMKPLGVKELTQVVMNAISLHTPDT